MLVLTRTTGQSIVIPDHDVTITVHSTEGNQVRLEISAPAAVRILRHELLGSRTSQADAASGPDKPLARALIADDATR